MSSLNPYDPFGPPALTQVIPGMINIADSAYYAEYGEAMVEAAEAGIESQRRWTLHHMGCIEKVDPIMGKEWVKQDDSIPHPRGHLRPARPDVRQAAGGGLPHGQTEAQGGMPPAGSGDALAGARPGA